MYNLQRKCGCGGVKIIEKVFLLPLLSNIKYRIDNISLFELKVQVNNYIYRRNLTFEIDKTTRREIFGPIVHL